MSQNHEQYGHSLMVEILPLIRERNLLDENDLRLMDSNDPVVSAAARERFFARRRPVWREMGLID